MLSWSRTVVALVCLALVPGVASASVVTLSGYFDDPANTALVASDLSAPLFVDDIDVANNVALYTLNVPVAGIVLFESLGYAAGGAEPYLTIFAGTGNGATFVDSSFFAPDIDFTVARLLGAGTYTIALGVYLNMSFAENNPDPDPSLADAFTALGVPGGLGSAYYELRVTTPSAVPEPASLLLVGAGLVAASIQRRRRSRRI